MRLLISSIVLATLVAGSAIPVLAANGRDRNGSAQNGERRDCVVTGWTDWALTRPIFKCPDDEAPAKSRRR